MNIIEFTIRDIVRFTMMDERELTLQIGKRSLLIHDLEKKIQNLDTSGKIDHLRSEIKELSMIVDYKKENQPK